jgi:hypothetical protein
MILMFLTGAMFSLHALPGGRPPPPHDTVKAKPLLVSNDQ